MGVRIGDTVTVTVTGKVTWEGDKVIEVEMPGQEDGHLIFRANAKITKVAPPLPTTPGSVVAYEGVLAALASDGKTWVWLSSYPSQARLSVNPPPTVVFDAGK